MQVSQTPARRPLLLCLSHLRWNFVTQRPQHLLTRAAQRFDVVFWEEPLCGPPQASPTLDFETIPGGITVVRPILPDGVSQAASDSMQRRLLDDYLLSRPGGVDVCWFYTPMAMSFAAHVEAKTTIYDCMDELSAFDGASLQLILLERRLMRRTDIVFTGGASLQRAKQPLHPDVHCFPSAVDQAHFSQVRGRRGREPKDQVAIPRPRIGFFGVLDERLDAALVERVADLRPDWQFILLGPTAKIDPQDLPCGANIHWLGRKDYAALPDYLASWDAGLMPFAINQATRFISPTKTPEFLAAGVPLVSTPVADVVAGWNGVVSIASSAEAVVAALDAAMTRPRAPWLAQVDKALNGLSWDGVWAAMLAMIEDRQSPADKTRQAIDVIKA